jgi:TatD DNase family protein
MIHCREAFHDLIQILTSNRQLLNSNPGVVHFFSGTMDDAAHLMDLGFSFSLGGVITFARAYEKIVKGLPLERILLETDAPYVTPQAYRGQRNEPMYVEEVAKKIAKILGKDVDEIAKVTTENARKVFNI